MKFPNTTATVVAVEQAREKGYWQIGDAIEKDYRMSKFDNDAAFYRACAEQMAATGYPQYSIVYLRHLRVTAVAFKKEYRDPTLSWGTHNEAGTPNNLRTAAAALRKLKKTVTIPHVRWIMKSWREKAAAERKQEHGAASAAEKAARAKHAAAARRKLAAKEKHEKEAAEQERLEAKRERDEAKKRREQSASTPPANTDVQSELQDKGTLTVMALQLSVTKRATQIEQLARRSLEELESILPDLTAAMAEEVVDLNKKIIQIVQAMNDRIAAHKRERFTVHAGGVVA